MNDQAIAAVQALNDKLQRLNEMLERLAEIADKSYRTWQSTQSAAFCEKHEMHYSV